MVSVLASSAVDRSGQIKDYTIGMCCFSAKHAAFLRVQTTIDWLEIRIMCPYGAKCISVDCCFSELALSKSNSACWSRTKRTSTPSSSH
jgi:hypothetical protein